MTVASTTKSDKIKRRTRQTAEAAPALDPEEQEMRRRSERVQQETLKRQDAMNKGRRFPKKSVPYRDLQQLTRIELEDYAMEVGLRPRDLELPTDKLMKNIMDFECLLMEIALSDD